MEETTELAELERAVGGFLDATPDPRVDLPLTQQVRRLIEWACAERPAHFTRSVPVKATDHDELITLALGKLVRRLRDVTAERDEARAIVSCSFCQSRFDEPPGRAVVPPAGGEW